MANSSTDPGASVKFRVIHVHYFLIFYLHSLSMMYLTRQSFSRLVSMIANLRCVGYKRSSLRQCLHNIFIPCTGLLLTESHVLVDGVGRHQVVARVLSAPVTARLGEGVGVRAEIDKVDPSGCRGEGNQAK